MANKKLLNNIFASICFVTIQVSTCLSLLMFVFGQNWGIGATWNQSHWKLYSSYYLLFIFIFSWIQLVLSLLLQVFCNTRRCVGCICWSNCEYNTFMKGLLNVMAFLLFVGPVLVGFTVCFSAAEDVIKTMVVISATQHAVFSCILLAFPHAYFCYEVAVALQEPLLSADDMRYSPTASSDFNSGSYSSVQEV